MATNNPSNVIVYHDEQSPMQLLYDTWMFRPHIIINHRQPKPDVLPHELQAMYRLIGKFLRAKPLFDNGSILCFRQGTWKVPRISSWHARLYVPIKVYKEEAKLVIQVSKL